MPVRVAAPGEAPSIASQPDKNHDEGSSNRGMRKRDEGHGRRREKTNNTDGCYFLGLFDLNAPLAISRSQVSTPSESLEFGQASSGRCNSVIFTLPLLHDFQKQPKKETDWTRNSIEKKLEVDNQDCVCRLSPINPFQLLHCGPRIIIEIFTFQKPSRF